MNGVMIIPTGIGCAIGGHAGDATPAAKLIAECCDRLIIHPNVVNASDINEMTPNMLYVEGSILDRFLLGEIRLKEVRSNKILLVANAPLSKETVNAVNAARATIGADIEMIELETPLVMTATMTGGVAGGFVDGHEEMAKQVKGQDLPYDAVAVHTPIDVPRDVALRYYREGGINPWGGVEAKASKLIAGLLHCQVAHAPLESTSPDDEELYFIFQSEEINPRLAAEAVSNCYLHCVLKGLHRAPQIRQEGIAVEDDIDFMISPNGCYGEPHKHCDDMQIPVIVVRENTTVLNNAMPRDYIFVDTYLEAAGIIMAMRAGVKPSSTRAD